jgi:adenine deaminase
MDNQLHSLVDEIESASGKIDADMYITNLKILDVYTETVHPGAMVIKNGKIVAINPSWKVRSKREFDGLGMFALPGFMDAHVHIETTLLTPEALARVIVPWGTTTMFVDAMEIANVLGIKGLRALLSNTANLPFRTFMEVPSRVPTAPGLETTGGVLGLMEVDELMDDETAVSLGELDPSKVLEIKIEYLEKILSAKKRNKICNGHAIGLDWDQLNAYATAGISDDHESVTYEELFDRLRLGIRAFIREGSTERNVDKLISGVIKNQLPTEDLLFCTDDKHVNDIASEGHISYNIQRAIDLGMDPVKAIKIGTINAARHFRIDHQLGALSPGKFADIVLLKDLKRIRPDYVFKAGEPVAANGKLNREISGDYPEFLKSTLVLSPDLCPRDFKVSAKENQAKVKVINLYPDQIINFATEEWLEISGGVIQPNVDDDILKLSVVERYGKNGQVASAFVRGFKLKSGALASSVAHDHHNIIIVGTNDEDMYLAARELGKCQGGFVAIDNGAVKGILPLPIGGLMSPNPAMKVMKEIDALNRVVENMGSDLPSPFMSLSFVSLPTVPELGLTDQGLIEVKAHRKIPVVVSQQ